MKLEGEKFNETDATAELIRTMVRDHARRGEYMIMMHDDDEEAFVQIAGDYDQVGGRDDDCFDLEYREGKNGCLYHCTRRVSADEAEAAFLDELDGRMAWRSRYEWEKMDGYGPSSGKPFAFGKKWICIAVALLALAYVGHAAYLWAQYGPPTGVCTKCLIYWGKHRIISGHHYPERAPLRWTIGGEK